MKKMALVMAFGVIAATVNAQDNKLYLKGGYNLANVSVDGDGAVDDARSLSSFHAGLMVDLPIGAGLLSLQPGFSLPERVQRCRMANLLMPVISGLPPIPNTLKYR